jgi:hypothetical protein
MKALLVAIIATAVTVIAIRFTSPSMLKLELVIAAGAAVLWLLIAIVAEWWL